MEITIKLSEKDYRKGMEHHQLTKYEDAVKLIKDAFLRGTIGVDVPGGRIESWISHEPDEVCAGVIFYSDKGEGEAVDLVTANINNETGDITQFVYEDPWTEDWTRKNEIPLEKWEEVFCK